MRRDQVFISFILFVLFPDALVKRSEATRTGRGVAHTLIARSDREKSESVPQAVQFSNENEEMKEEGESERRGESMIRAESKIAACP